MSALPLTTAMVTYGHTRALKDGTIRSERLQFEHRDVSPIPNAFRRMVRGLEFDVAEMALSTYLCARTYHKPIVALPIFLLRRFEHASIVCTAQSGIQSPADLHGRRVGVRSYTLTPGVWVRGILQHAYHVDLQRVQWVIFGDEHVQEYTVPEQVTFAPAGSDMVSMLRTGELDAAIGVRSQDAPGLRPLIPAAGNAAAAYYRHTGIYPISHLVVVKHALLQEYPWLAEELWTLFTAAKDQYLSRLRSATRLDPQDTAMQAMQQVVGDDPFLYSVAPNRPTLEAFIGFNVEQQIIPQRVELKDLFPQSVLS
jgi:4,5-dihydroxyphthalate decarboxylase